MLFTFVRPLVSQASTFADALPAFVEDAQQGRGRVGALVERYNVEGFIEDNQDRFRSAVRDLGANSLSLLSSFANTVAAVLTILVLAFLITTEGPNLTSSALSLADPGRRHRIRKVAADCSKACTGYMAGALLICVIAGSTTFLFLTIAGVPFSGVLGLWVGFAALIPLIGATLGAIPTVLVAFLHSTPAGIAALIFYIAYQQVENNFLQPTIMSRTVNLNPLAVLTAVLVGVELFGLLGALLSIPVAGMLQVIVRDLWDHRRGKWKDIPTIGEEEVPLGADPNRPPEAPVNSQGLPDAAQVEATGPVKVEISGGVEQLSRPVQRIPDINEPGVGGGKPEAD